MKLKSKPKAKSRNARPGKTPKIRKPLNLKPLLWITDPWGTLDHAQDTTLRLIEASLERGAVCHWADVRSIRFQEGQVLVPTCLIESLGSDREPSQIRLKAPTLRPLTDFSRVFYRTDPPVDLAYLQPLQLLLQGAQAARKTEFVPSLALLLQHNEKLEAHALKGLLPPTLATADLEALVSWGTGEKVAVLKPLHQAQSKGVEKLHFDSPANLADARRKLHAATEGGRMPVLLQRFLPGILKGETRLWFLNGKLLACATKLPKAGQFRIDMDQGGSLAPHTLNAQERKAAMAIGRHLRALRIRLAAIDLIEGFVTDFNFTSPGLIVDMEKTLGRDLAGPIATSILRPWN